MAGGPSRESVAWPSAPGWCAVLAVVRIVGLDCVTAEDGGDREYEDADRGDQHFGRRRQKAAQRQDDDDAGETGEGDAEAAQNLAENIHDTTVYIRRFCRKMG